MPTYSTLVSTTLSAGSLPGGWSPSFVLTDINGDGKLDLVAAFSESISTGVTWNPAPVKFFLGDGTGKFTDVTSTYFPTNDPMVVAATGDIKIGDFNGDGKVDFFITDLGKDADPFPGATNQLILSSPTGYVNATSTLPQALNWNHSAVVGDINGDGKLDIYVGSIGGPNGGAGVGPYFLINDGSGHFTPTQSGLPAPLTDTTQVHYTSDALVDLNGDGKLDLVLGVWRNPGETTSNQIFYNDGAGHFTPGPTLPTLFPGVRIGIPDMHVLDLNGDGLPDIVMNYAVNYGASSFVQVLINGPGGFTDQSAAWLPSNVGTGNVSSLKFADINGDGLVDMIQSGGTTSPVWLNTGEGNFIHMDGVMPVSSAFDLLNVADVNGDGRPDIEIYPVVNGANILLRTVLNTDAGATQTGDAGNNAFMGDSTSENMSGLAGNDTFVAGLGDDTVSGGDGNDSIYGGGGNDSLDGGTGDDQVFGGQGSDTITDSGGTNYLRGGDGNDSVSGGSGFDDINGNQGNDTEHGNAGDDWVVGGKGDDVLFGDAGDDIVWGNLGNDTLDGGDGADQVRGGQGDDILFGGAGNDYLSGDRGNDTITGGTGADLFHTFNGAGIDKVLDFSSAEGDRVMLDPGTTYTVSQVGADTVIDMGSGDKMTLVGVTLSTLPTGWIFGA